MSLYHCNYIIYSYLSQLTTERSVCYINATYPPNHYHLSTLNRQLILVCYMAVKCGQ